MSLLDALLLEPPRFEVWIALRTDGVLGSGTQAAPYEGSAIKIAPLRIASLANPGANKFEAVVITERDHGFKDNDIIRIAKSLNPADGDWRDGTFRIYGAGGRTFKYLMQREPLSSSSTERVVQAFRFDDGMDIGWSSAPPNRE